MPFTLPRLKTSATKLSLLRAESARCVWAIDCRSSSDAASRSQRQKRRRKQNDCCAADRAERARTIRRAEKFHQPRAELARVQSASARGSAGSKPAIARAGKIPDDCQLES